MSNKKRKKRTPNVPVASAQPSAQAQPTKRVSQRQRRRQRGQLWVWIAGAGAVVLVVALILFSNANQTAGAPPVTDLSPELVNRAVKGLPEAQVVVTEFSDFECPACKSFAEGSAKQLEEEYVKTGKIRFEYKHYPLPQNDPGATRAANAAECAADQGKFWEMHDYLFQEQGLQGPNTFSIGRLRSMGEELGLGMDQYNDCLSRETHRQEILNDVNEARQLLVNATPTIFVNERRLEGPSYADVKAAIETELARIGP